jgi:hypothetical protein
MMTAVADALLADTTRLKAALCHVQEAVQAVVPAVGAGAGWTDVSRVLGSLDPDARNRLRRTFSAAARFRMRCEGTTTRSAISWPACTP